MRSIGSGYWEFCDSQVSAWAFFVFMPIEFLLPIYLSQGVNPFILFLISLITAFLALLLDYGVGYLLSRKVIYDLIGKKRYDKYNLQLDKYGKLLIFAFSLLPLPSPIVILIAGTLRCCLKDAMIYSFLGLSIKYLALIFLFFLVV